MPLSSTILTLIPEQLREPSILSVLLSYCVFIQENENILYLGSDYAVDSNDSEPAKPKDLIVSSANVMFFTCNSPRPLTPPSLVAKKPFTFNRASAVLLNDEVRYWNIANPENPAHLEYDQDTEAATMIMPKIEGDTLDKWFYRPESDSQIQLLIFHALAIKLQQLHIRGLCHNDIQPGNIIIEYVHEILTVTIIDFGLCKPASPLEINRDIRALCIMVYEKLITDNKSAIFKEIEEVYLENIKHPLAHIIEITESSLIDPNNDADLLPSPMQVPSSG